MAHHCFCLLFALITEDYFDLQTEFNPLDSSHQVKLFDYIPSLPDDFAEPEVCRPEVVGPLRDAVRLVHAHERDGRQVADQRGEHGASWKNK